MMLTKNFKIEECYTELRYNKYNLEEQSEILSSSQSGSKASQDMDRTWSEHGVGTIRKMKTLQEHVL